MSGTAAPDAARVLDARWDGKTTFKVPEVAEILRLGLCSAWSAVNRGEIPSVKIGRRVIVPRAAIERMLSK